MASNHFTDYDQNNPITAGWLNGINDAVYQLLGDGTNAYTTVDQVKNRYQISQNTITVQAIRLLNKFGSNSVNCDGYYGAGDGVCGRFHLISYDPTGFTDDGGSIIIGVDGGVWKRCFSEPVTIRDFGAQPSNADNTTYIQNAVNYVQTLSTSDFWATYGPSLRFNSGIWNWNGITVSYPITIFGAGSNAVSMNLLNGANNNAITIADMGGLSGSDAGNIMPTIQGMTLNCNSTGQTSTFARGISLTDSATPIATQYRGGANIYDVTVRAAKQFSLYIGNNRNNGRIDRFKTLYSGQEAVYSNAYDWRASNSDFGNSQATHGWNQAVGGATEWVNCNFFFNQGRGLTIGTGVNASCIATNCYFDTNGTQGVFVDNGYGDIVCHSLTNNVFRDNSRLANGGAPHIQLNNVQFINIIGNSFPVNTQGTQPSYLVFMGGTYGPVTFAGNSFEVNDVANRPYTVDITNDFTRLVVSGTENIGFNQLGAYTMGVVGWNASGSMNFDYMDMGSSTSGSRRWRNRVAGNTYFFQTADDSGTSTSDIFNVTRTGTTPNSINTIPVKPISDNIFPLGDATHRWSVVYAGTASINTSDEREKQQIAAITDQVLDAWQDVEYMQFKFNDMVEEKGDDKARYHFGLMAQRVRDNFIAHSLDATKFGILCYDKWDAKEAVVDESGTILTPEVVAGDRWGLRYEECLCLEAALMRRTIKRLQDSH